MLVRAFSSVFSSMTIELLLWSVKLRSQPDDSNQARTFEAILDVFDGLSGESVNVTHQSPL